MMVETMVKMVIVVLTVSISVKSDQVTHHSMEKQIQRTIPLQIDLAISPALS